MREIPVFSGMDSGRLKLIACVAATTEFRGGDVVLASGSPADAVLIIASGVLAVDASGEDQRFERGDLLGELSVLSGADEPNTVVAVGDAKGVVIAQNTRSCNDLCCATSHYGSSKRGYSSTRLTGSPRPPREYPRPSESSENR